MIDTPARAGVFFYIFGNGEICGFLGKAVSIQAPGDVTAFHESLSHDTFSNVDENEVMTAELDNDFGTPRGPEKVDSWEISRKPVSLVKLSDAAASLKSLSELADKPLLSAAVRAKNFLWIMDQGGEIYVAVEELAPNVRGAPYSGFPRRRAYTHPAEEKKLGHPTLIDAGKARIAGELAFDRSAVNEAFKLVLNANSGRYCRQNPPTLEQVNRIADRFRAHGLEIQVDIY